MAEVCRDSRGIEVGLLWVGTVGKIRLSLMQYTHSATSNRAMVMFEVLSLFFLAADVFQLAAGGSVMKKVTTCWQVF